MVTGHADDDAIVNKVGDQFGIPPQFLYSQAHYEGAFGSKNASNFRYEPLTVDFANFSGDDPRSTIDPSGVRYVADPIFSPYLINGHALQANNAPTGLPSQAANFTADAGTALPFSLGGPVMAATGNPGNPVANTSALFTVTLQDANKNQETIQQVVWSPYTWIKAGPHCKQVNPCVPAATYYGQQTPKFGMGPNPAPIGNQFAIDYVKGSVTLGRPLNQGEKLTMTYYPVSANQIPITIGSASAANLSGIKTGFAKLTFNPGQSLADWAANNLSLSDVNYQFGNFLTGTDSEKSWMFSAAGSSSKHANPIAPLDGRFNGATAQFFAATSYGIIQVLARTLVDPNYGPALQGAVANRTLFPTGTFFDALNNLTAGFSLGAAYTQGSLQSIIRNPSLGKSPTLRRARRSD
jgi:hypothetical protein